MKTGKFSSPFNILQTIKWGEKSFVALYLSVLSGIVLSLQYDPSTPLYSVTTIELLVPFGAFWRALHFYSSQLFFLFFLLHLYIILDGKHPQPDQVPPKIAKSPLFPPDKKGMRRRWIKLILSLPVVVLLLFTGYVLRGDGTGEFAGIIAENIILSIPFIGKLLNSMLFSISNSGMKVVYANHLIGLGVVWGVLSWDHLRRYKVTWREHGWILTGLMLISFLIKAPLELAGLGIFHIKGPWFFVGLQELLRYVQPFWAGVVFPLTSIIALVYAVGKSPLRKYSLIYLIFWLVTYTALTIIGFLR